MTHLTFQQAKALAHVDRLAIMDLLSLTDGTFKPGDKVTLDGVVFTVQPVYMTVQQLADLLNRSHSATSLHLTQLRNAGLITQRREGTTTWNSLAPGVVWPIVVVRS